MRACVHTCASVRPLYASRRAAYRAGYRAGFRAGYYAGRANIYRQPRVLFLDEATSQLDHATERRVIDSLGTLNVTTISVAHRNNALAAASRFIDLGN